MKGQMKFSLLLCVSDFIREEMITISIYKTFALGYKFKLYNSREMINSGCGLYTGFQNIILDYHGVRVIHRCGLYTGN